MTLQADRKLSWPDRVQTAAWWMNGGVFGPIWRFAAAIAITTGPWLMAVAALWLIAMGLQPVLSKAAIQDFGLSVTYAFCLASLVAGPVGAVAARAIRIAVDDAQCRFVTEMFLMATVIAGIVAQVLALLLVVSLGLLPTGLAIAHVFLSVAGAMLWVCFSVLAALRLYRFLIGAFAVSMGASVACCLLLARLQPTVELSIWSVTLGLCLCVALCLARVGRSYGRQSDQLWAAGSQLARQFRTNRHLALAVVVAISAVWVDKWFFWFGPVGARSAAGFAHFGPYDSVVFLAQLSIVPTFAAVFQLNEGGIADGVADFRQKIKDHANLALIREAVGNLGRLIWKGMFRTGFTQATVSLALVLGTPALSRVLHFGQQQMALLPLSLVSVFLQSVIYMSCAALIVCSRTQTFLRIQSLFLVTNLGLSVLFYYLIGVSAYAIFASSLLCAIIGIHASFRALRAYDYHVYLGENDSLYSRQ
jgi:polysaccharide biosynthesis protein PelG